MNHPASFPRLRYFDPSPVEPREIEVDICVYGGTSGGVVAAIEAARRGLTVALVAPERRLGGMTSGGLGMTDIGAKEAIGGIAREFYQRVGRRYGAEMEWRFEPHVAEAVFEQWLVEHDVRVFRGEFLEKVRSADDKIGALRTISGLVVRAKAFVDAGYEGDLMAAAGVRYTIGREGNDKYGERLNGAQIHHGHQFTTDIDPYVVAGDPASGLLPGIEDGGTGFKPGEGDHRIQAYNFRMCLTDREDIRLPFPKPEGYRAGDYELLRRVAASGWDEWFEKFDRIRGGKTDTNNHGPVSTDFIGRNHLYPEYDYAGRERIFQQHVVWQQGMMWTLANDPGMPSSLRERFSRWGLCRDEFVSTGGWPTALYVRESRRMVSDRVMTEADCRHVRRAGDPVALGAYNMDSHHCRRLLIGGVLRNEGDVQERVPGAYPVSYRSIIPARGQAKNLFVPFCLSASHVAFGSIRMEPVFMELAQASVVAASLCLSAGVASQDLIYGDLRQALLAVRAKLDIDTSDATPPTVGVRVD